MLFSLLKLVMPSQQKKFNCGSKVSRKNKTRWGNDNGIFTCQYHNTQYFITKATRVRTKPEYAEYMNAGIFEWFQTSQLHTDTHTRACVCSNTPWLTWHYFVALQCCLTFNSKLNITDIFKIFYSTNDKTKFNLFPTHLNRT